MNWQEWINVDPNLCHGQACIKGTRIMVSVVLDNVMEIIRRLLEPIAKEQVSHCLWIVEEKRIRIRK